MNDPQLIVIVGGSGQLGLRLSEHLSRAGHQIIVGDIHKPTVNAETTVQFRCIDLLDRHEIKNFADSVEEEYGVPDVLIYVAHYKGPRNLTPGSPFFSSLHLYPIDEWERTIGVNLTGLFSVTQAFLPSMMARGRGNIIATSSTYGLVSAQPQIYGDSGINSPVGYGVTKAGTIAFVKYLAVHYANVGIRANCLVPGGISNANQTPEFVRAYAERTPAGRLSTADDYLPAIDFLIDPANSYMTGSTIVVDGGWTSI